MKLDNVKILRHAKAQTKTSHASGMLVAADVREVSVALPEGVVTCLELVAESGETFFIALKQED